MIAASLRYFWRQHLAVTAGVAVSTLILVGALLVGDSVRFSLERLALLRLGKTEAAVVSQHNFFRQEAGGVPVLLLQGIVATPDEARRANKAQIVGVDERFWALGQRAGPGTGGTFINEALARRLGMTTGDVVVRLEKPSWLPRDAPLATEKDLMVASRLKVTGVVGDDQMGRFSLAANQIPTPTIFVPLNWLQQLVGKPGRANVALFTARADIDWTLDDADFELQALPGGKGWQVSSRNVFFSESVPGATPIFTYFVNAIRHGERATPYSIVSAGTVPVGDDEIVLNAWLAEDLQAKPGDAVTLRYFVMGPARTLTERDATFRVRAVIPVERDAELMPQFPGLHEAESCRDWDPGIPVELERLRDKDQAYWEQYRGTPKAFISLASAQKIWETRFGNLTALRWPATTNRAEIEVALSATLTPPAVQPVRELALKASRESFDFGQLFIGFSFFLIIAALLLTGLLFAFGIEQRRREIGTLLAIGWTHGRVLPRFLVEGLMIAVGGAVIGTLAGTLYTRAAIAGLSSVWSGAVSGAELQFHATPAKMLTGALAGVVVALGVIWLGVRRWAKLPARVLLARDVVTARGEGGGRWWARTARAAPAAAVALLVFLPGHPAAFFGAGALLLVAGIGMCARWVRGRGLATVALLACGCFVVIAVGANRHGPSAVGAGGFDFVAETTVSFLKDANDPAVRDEFGLPNARYTPVRVRDGDDASCLNLNRAQTPRLLGVNPHELAGRFGANWALLEHDGDAVPAIGDEATVRWALGRGVGDTIDSADENGRPFRLRIVGMMPNSVLQGSLVIAERDFVSKFPSESGYRLWLIEGDASGLARALADFGAEVQLTRDRLAEFAAVENTYLTIFQSLGGLGLLLGSVGLGIVVLRNVGERRAELALRRAVGYSRRRLQRLVFADHWRLLALGLLIGVGAAVVAVVPALRSPEQLPVGSLAVTLLAIAVSGLVWIWLATRAALQGRLLDALRSE